MVIHFYKSVFSTSWSVVTIVVIEDHLLELVISNCDLSVIPSLLYLLSNIILF